MLNCKRIFILDRAIALSTVKGGDLRSKYYRLLTKRSYTLELEGISPLPSGERLYFYPAFSEKAGGVWGKAPYAKDIKLPF